MILMPGAHTCFSRADRRRLSSTTGTGHGDARSTRDEKGV